MKAKLVLILAVLFIVLTFAGGIHVLSSKGKASAGFAVVPSVFAVSTVSLYMNIKNKE